ncbi:hypothetical protein ACFO4O_09380 [Glaciecola siphonariae]|uniref:Uncharacterized protein n=1 Tax=Glaciecola siphonariae TaxID=521012 RepID=A0ABV9LV20_9ALTE
MATHLKPNMILKQNIPYAALIYSALDLCDIMLTRSSTLYPFAVMSIDNDVQCVFTPNLNEHPQNGMIEDLSAQCREQRLLAENAISVIVYCATISTPQGDESDAIVFNITDSNDKNTVTLYPYEHDTNAIKLGIPFTCDFAD